MIILKYIILIQLNLTPGEDLNSIGNPVKNMLYFFIAVLILQI
ncbi:hypothetical protein HDE69_004304 [Pedobacter cryoconitis]|uniref:Uncharacterized protein n=1 Tax=Pedobacter cryoconitis TaxID=188932 RepID=A0A7W8YWP1_9SPHI|nr:hypothetical protein [Pedobacter cryoconitis]MBB5648448.1 hypothetical protein [Pedobacter cryoconitis]